jgi:hypothetical protein
MTATTMDEAIAAADRAARLADEALAAGRAVLASAPAAKAVGAAPAAISEPAQEPLTAPRKRAPWEYGANASPEVQAALDALDAQVEAAQAKADAANAAHYDPDAPLGRVNPASVWDALDDGREQAQWDRTVESAEASVARIAEQAAKDSRPPGWDY